MSVENPEFEEGVLLKQFEDSLKGLSRRRQPQPLSEDKFNRSVIANRLEKAGLGIKYLKENSVFQEVFTLPDNSFGVTHAPNFNSGRGSLLSAALGGTQWSEKYYQWVQERTRLSPPAAFALLDYSVELIGSASGLVTPRELIRRTNWRVIKAHEFYGQTDPELRQSFGVPNPGSSAYKSYLGIHPIPPGSPYDAWRQLLSFHRKSLRSNLD